ncbi:MAG: hypothetical protein KBF11_05785 [Desulfomicrobium sp.]|nr:hypothetical protein [Desulfomicrobium sp.]
MSRYVLCLMVLLGCVLPAVADQRVSVAVDAGESREALVARVFDTALEQEVDALLGTQLAPSRKKTLMEILSKERETLILGYSEDEAAAEANATGLTRAMTVRVHGAGLKARLRDMGVMFTLKDSKPYVLQLSGVEPSRTKRLGALQELSGLKPVAAAAQGVPVLALSQMGAWTGVLSLGEWRTSHTAKTLDEVWLAVWKNYFSRPGVAAQGESGLLVRVSGWLSSMGPMEFDKLMDTWNEEIGQKTLVGVEMEGSGMVGVWRVQTRSRDALARRLGDAAKTQGLTVEIR